MTARGTIRKSIIRHPTAARANALLINAFTLRALATMTANRAIRLSTTENQIAAVASARSFRFRFSLARIFIVVIVIIIIRIVQIGIIKRLIEQRMILIRRFGRSNWSSLFFFDLIIRDFAIAIIALETDILSRRNRFGVGVGVGIGISVGISVRIRIKVRRISNADTIIADTGSAINRASLARF